MHELSPEEARRASEQSAAALFGPAEPTAVEEIAVPSSAGSIRVRLYRSEDLGTNLPLLVYFHGGGWVVGSLDTHDGVCRALARRGRCAVASVDYRRAPEHRFPAAVEDSWAATVALAERGAVVAVGGDSAGGTLAAAVALRARDRDLPLALQLLVYPVTDHRFDTPSYSECAEGYGLTRAAMEWYWAQYLGAGDGSSPEASPLRADELSGVAPALVLTAEYDPLRDEGETYARRLQEAGVPVTLSRYNGLIHGFFRMPGVLDRAQEALDEAASALRAAFSTRPQAVDRGS